MSGIDYAEPGQSSLKPIKKGLTRENHGESDP